MEKKKSYNIIVSSSMKLFNIIKNIDYNLKENNFIINYLLESILVILYPITPHICHFLWEMVYKNKSILSMTWPKKINIKEIIIQTYNLIIQINGKFKMIIKIKKNKSKTYIINYIFNKTTIKKYLNQNDIKRIIYIKNKLINIIH